MANLKGMLVVGGLVAALGSGCEKESYRSLANCEIKEGNISRVDISYHQSSGHKDDFSVLFIGKDNTVHAQIMFEKGVFDDTLMLGVIDCKDGRVIKIESDGDVYFRGGQ
ncbi:MAG: hypothetical protein AABX27_01300 [Nanoarchaeota archaeon]